MVTTRQRDPNQEPIQLKDAGGAIEVEPQPQPKRPKTVPLQAADAEIENDIKNFYQKESERLDAAEPDGDKADDQRAASINNAGQEDYVPKDGEDQDDEGALDDAVPAKEAMAEKGEDDGEEAVEGEDKEVVDVQEFVDNEADADTGKKEVNKSGAPNPYEGLDGIKVGDKAKDFKLKDQDGDEMSLSAMKGKFVLIYWFNDPEDPNVKKGGEAFKKAFPMMQKTGAELVFVGPCSQEQCKKLKTEGKLPFPILADPDMKVAKQYSNVKDGAVMRTSVLVDKDGKILNVMADIPANKVTQNPMEGVAFLKAHLGISA